MFEFAVDEDHRPWPECMGGQQNITLSSRLKVGRIEWRLPPTTTASDPGTPVCRPLLVDGRPWIFVQHHGNRSSQDGEGTGSRKHRPYAFDACFVVRSHRHGQYRAQSRGEDLLDKRAEIGGVSVPVRATRRGHRESGCGLWRGSRIGPGSVLFQRLVVACSGYRACPCCQRFEQGARGRRSRFGPGISLGRKCKDWFGRTCLDRLAPDHGNLGGDGACQSATDRPARRRLPVGVRPAAPTTWTTRGGSDRKIRA